jgi:hypothetical protein
MPQSAPQLFSVENLQTNQNSKGVPIRPAHLMLQKMKLTAFLNLAR